MARINWYRITLFLNTAMLISIYLVLRDTRIERDEARKETAAWKVRAEANDPLVVQWRTGYEKLKAKCDETFSLYMSLNNQLKAQCDGK